MSPAPGRLSLYIRWSGMFFLVLFGWLAILLELAPLNEAAGALPSPDILLCVVIFLVVRRPVGTPGVLVLALGLARDLLGGGPVGLGALVLLAAAETVRALAGPLRRRSRLYEFAMVAALAAATALAQVIVLTMTFAALPPLELLGLRFLMTVGAYLVVFVLFRQVLRIRAERSSELRLGRAPA